MIRERGGVGYYPTSAHPVRARRYSRVRHWPRMPRDELALLFPSGRTQHQPASGGPISLDDVRVARAKPARKWQQQVAAYFDMPQHSRRTADRRRGGEPAAPAAPAARPQQTAGAHRRARSRKPARDRAAAQGLPASACGSLGGPAATDGAPRDGKTARLADAAGRGRPRRLTRLITASADRVPGAPIRRSAASRRPRCRGGAAAQPRRPLRGRIGRRIAVRVRSRAVSPRSRRALPRSSRSRLPPRPRNERRRRLGLQRPGRRARVRRGPSGGALLPAVPARSRC